MTEDSKQEHALHRAYLRLRDIIPGAHRTPFAPSSEQVFEVVETAARALVAERDALLKEVEVLRAQRMQPERERELLHANNRYLERARAAERAAAADPWQARAAWVATQILLYLQMERRQGVRDEACISLDHQVGLLQEIARKDNEGVRAAGDLGWAAAMLTQKGLITAEFVADLLIQCETSFPNGLQPLTFQQRVAQMMDHVCNDADPTDLIERGDRAAEEVFELFQSLGWEEQRLVQLMGYVYSRPIGEPPQEMGGTLVTIAGLANHAGLDMMACAEHELERCNTPEVIAKIRAKRAARPRDGSPLPGKPADWREGMSTIELLGGE